MTARIPTVMADPAEGEPHRAPECRGVILQAKGLTLRTRAGANLVSDISFHVEPGELVALTGLSYADKSVLLQSLAGLMKPASGQILIDGMDLYGNLKAFRSSIGFVPADFALQQSLTVAETLYDAATLRLPRHTAEQDRRQRVWELLKTVGLEPVGDRQAGLLSRAEKRRLGIAVEVMGYPGLLLVDGSAEQLSPFDEMQINVLLHELSRQGLTVVQVDQRARSAGLADKIIFLGPGGSLAWFGPTDEAFAYLRGFLPKGIARDLFGLKEALEILANPQIDEGNEWAMRFKAQAAYQKYVDDPLQNKYPDLLLQTSPLLRLRSRNSSQETLPPAAIPRANLVQKFILLIRRDLLLLWRGSRGLAMLALPPLVALFDFVLSSAAASDPGRAPVVSSVLVFLILLTAALLAQDKIFEERAVYQREARTSSLVLPYVLSKASTVGVWAVYQGIIWALVHFVATGTAGGLPALPFYGLTFFLVAFVGGILGLIASALSRTALAVTRWVLLLTIPQMLLDGALMPAGSLIPPLRLLSTVNPSRYAVESLLAASGYGAGPQVAPWGAWSMLAMLGLICLLLLLAVQHRAPAVVR